MNFGKEDKENITQNKSDCQTHLTENLTDYDEKTKVFEIHRSQADKVQKIYSYGKDEHYKKYSRRISLCADILNFKYKINFETGELDLKLKNAFFCKVRLCPICQWRSSLMLQAKFFKLVPKIQSLYPTHKWLFLTLTVKNCDIKDLSNTLEAMAKAWDRLNKRKELENIKGYVRSAEVTKSKDGKAHPHYHVLLLVAPSMLAKNYIKVNRWAELWGEALLVDYLPIVDIRVVKSKNKDVTPISSAIIETFKYSIKPADMINDPSFLFQLTNQIHKKRFFVFGGIIKKLMKEVELIKEADSNIIIIDDQSQNHNNIINNDNQNTTNEYGELLTFNWQTKSKKYIKKIT